MTAAMTPTPTPSPASTPASNETALHPTPSTGRVLREQVRFVGRMLRIPALVAVALVAMATVMIAVGVARDGIAMSFHPELSMIPGMAGLVLPLFVWKRHERFGSGFFWTLPVDSRTHALARVFAGWTWLMLAVALLVLWLLSSP